MESMFIYNTPVGKIGIREHEKCIVGVYFVDNIEDNNIKLNETPLIKKTSMQIKQYLEGNRCEFDIPIKLSGTKFQKKVWRCLMDIPYGETQTYKDIAIKINSPFAYRAVGMANNRNPISIIIPCHRVIGANGGLVGYGGGLRAKKMLLDIEEDKIRSKTNESNDSWSR